MKVGAYKGDITKVECDAIVNAANPTLCGGGGVDGAIHKAAGPELKAACMALPQLAHNIRCYPGSAAVTPGFNLPAKYVIHTVGPIFPAGRDPVFTGEHRMEQKEAKKVLARSILNCLEKAEELHCRSIAFPAVSCGFYGCPPWLFAQIAKKVLASKAWDIEWVEFVLFKEDEYDSFMTGWNI